MTARFAQSFKIQAVEKALTRGAGTGLKELADGFGVGYSTLSRWISEASHSEFDPEFTNARASRTIMAKEKRPQDWSAEERLEIVSRCSALVDEAIGGYCQLNPGCIKVDR